MGIAHYSKEQLQEMSFIEIAFEFLKDSKQPISFNELMNEMAGALGLSNEEVRKKIAQFYTDMNIDGRFLAIGENRWGLRTWYPVDTVEEEVVTTVKPKKKKAKKVLDEDDVDLEELDELEEDLDYDDLDDFDDDTDLLVDEEDFDDLDDDSEDFDDDELVEEEEEFDLEDEELDDLDEVDEEEEEDI
ncbi:DNA-directed RNA polymerase subunit delta [Bacillota bacterium Lsc_1132]